MQNLLYLEGIFNNALDKQDVKPMCQTHPETTQQNGATIILQKNNVYLPLTLKQWISPGTFLTINIFSFPVSPKQIKPTFY